MGYHAVKKLKMVSPSKIVVTKEDESPDQKKWDNPSNPERASDERDEEQLARQKKEAELRKSNLTDTPDNAD